MYVLCSDTEDWIAEWIASAIREMDTVFHFIAIVRVWPSPSHTGRPWGDGRWHYVAERRSIVDGALRWMPYPLDCSLDTFCWMRFEPWISRGPSWD